jgi:hypothetical protein
MGNHVRQAEFLCRLQECIDRYQPILEKEFRVSLGPVRAKRLVVSEFIRHCLDQAAELRRLEAIRKRGRPPTRLRRTLHAVEATVVYVPAYALLSVRFRLPDLMMKWVDEPPAVAVSLSGWSAADYERNARRLDQWTVHELAHGVWSRIAADRHQDHGRSWRIWNEGFAHCLADVHLRPAYPPQETLNTDWTGDRQLGRRLVAERVARDGPLVLREIPLRWAELDSLRVLRAARQTPTSWS